MKMKIVLLFLVALTVGVVSSCCDCPKYERYKTTLNSVSLTNLEKTKGIYTESGATGILKDSFGIRVNLLSMVSLAKAAKPRYSIFMNSANATSCKCGMNDYAPTNRVDNIKIFDLEKFDQNTALNADVTSRFRYGTGSGSMTIPEFVLNNYFPYSTYYGGVGPAKSYFDILLDKPPVAAGTHQFKVQIFMDNGSMLEATTTAVVLQ